MEFALVLPLLMMAALAIVQIGLVVRDRLAVAHAARLAVRVASVDRDPAHVVRSAQRVLPRAEVDVGPRPAIGGEIQVTVRLRSTTALPLIGALVPDPVLSSTAVMRVER